MSDALIRSLQDAVRSGRSVDCVFTQGTEVTAHPPAAPEAVEAAEAEVGFRLPDLLMRIYLEVGNGGFGPFYGLLGLDGGATDDLGYNALDQWFFARQELAAPRRRRRPRDLSLFPCLYHGCSEYVCLDCRSPDGQMWRFDMGTRPAGFEREGFSLSGLMGRWAEGPIDA